MRLSLKPGLFAAKTQPDEVDRPADSHKQADQGENPLVQPLVQPIPNAAPKEQSGQEVSKDRPHCILFAVSHGYSLLLGFGQR